MTSAALKVDHANRHLEEVTVAIGEFLASVDVGFEDEIDKRPDPPNRTASAMNMHTLLGSPCGGLLDRFTAVRA